MRRRHGMASREVDIQVAVDPLYSIGDGRAESVGGELEVDEVETDKLGVLKRRWGSGCEDGGRASY